MSLRQVLTIYNAERQLNEDDIALLNTLRKLNDNDRELLVQGLSDKPQKKSSKRVLERCERCDQTRRADEHKNTNLQDYHEFVVPQSSKKAAGGGERLSSKSAKASGMAKTLNDNLSQRRREALDDITGESKEPPRRCTATINDGIKRVCTQFADANIHHLRTDPNYHEFESAATSAAGGGG